MTEEAGEEDDVEDVECIEEGDESVSEELGWSGDEECGVEDGDGDDDEVLAAAL